jgi:hypothetical protein
MSPEERSKLVPSSGKAEKIPDLNIGDLMKAYGELALISLKKREMKNIIRLATKVLSRGNEYRKSHPEGFRYSGDLVSIINGAWILWLVGGDTRHSAANLLLFAQNKGSEAIQGSDALISLLERYGRTIGKAMTRGKFAAKHIGEKNWDDYAGICRVLNATTETL